MAVYLEQVSAVVPSTLPSHFQTRARTTKHTRSLAQRLVCHFVEHAIACLCDTNIVGDPKPLHTPYNPGGELWTRIAGTQQDSLPQIANLSRSTGRSWERVHQQEQEE